MVKSAVKVAFLNGLVSIGWLASADWKMQIDEFIEVTADVEATLRFCGAES
jgi:hypothetical protein